ncbi:HAMP domain-containing sensor histidine kinase [Colwellia psychrerythraea]|uniref:histidine kinase n=1 Tax=Colwellia psychrerythraea (strain 34H / ATCC BAA-681) TaxID=167879 RepID=Q47WA2_COLP3|nr:HAMP domain-containing sensor histidine kinase [Colwellia psychrerythraea]AAZ26815.1 sensor histidine kinase [Colwellia psychrerythraea 34H]
MTSLNNPKKSKRLPRQLTLSFFGFSLSFLNKISIKKLTLIGFTFVAMPLVMALIFGANKASELAQKSTSAIYNVAQLTQLNSKLDETIAKLERSASQFVVLKDDELLAIFSGHHKALIDIIQETSAKQQDKVLKEQLTSLKAESDRIKELMLNENIDTFSLEEIQQEFKPLQLINEQLEKRSTFVVNQQVLDIQQTTEEISDNILERLYIIPITLLIAGVFIILITKPLKRLTDEIQLLEQGSFEQEINLHGPAEVREIADALENMRQRLHALELQKSSFIRHISHELKTPLAAIREGTELIYDNSVGPLNEDQQEICDIIRVSVNRLQRLIEDLLDFNIVLDSTSLHGLEKISLSELINDACNVRKLDIKSKNLTMKCNNSPYFVYSNSKQLSVILDNILSNAIKYSPVNGDITITYSSSKECITINIIDQGPGIDPSLSEKVFDAFYQGKAPINSQIKGSGLGLTIVKELLLRLNGKIEVIPARKISAANESGACITITLPNTQTDNEL